jgi:sodium/proline symporter
MIGWIVGDLLASLWIYRRLRLATEAVGELSFAGVVSNWSGTPQKYVRILSAVLTIAFLGAYSAAQFSAGGKALQALFNWNVNTGAVLVAVIVAIYCISGGIRASMWTDVAQSAVMLIAMSMLMFSAINNLGGVSASLDRLNQIPGHMNWFPRDLLMPGVGGIMLFVIGWLFAGLSVAGQPHIMVRFMALERPEQLSNARWWYYSFFVVFYAMATAVGLLSRVYLPNLSQLDPELALPTMAQSLLPPVAVGIALAGIFAATMSTADSLVLSCSASLTNDPLPKLRADWRTSKAATLLVTCFALAIAMRGPSSVFQLVIMAWSTLGAVFVPLLPVLAAGGRPSQPLALTMMLTGFGMNLLWRQQQLDGYVFEGMPAMIAALLVYAAARTITPRALSLSETHGNS